MKILLVFLSILTTSCATLPSDWYDTGRDAYRYEWRQVRWEDIERVCQGQQSLEQGECVTFPWHFYGAADKAMVYSAFTEEQAKRINGHDGLTLWEHAMRHVNGQDHRSLSVPSLTRRQGVVM